MRRESSQYPARTAPLSAPKVSRKHRNVIGVVVGNETIYTGIYLDQKQIDELKKKGTYKGQKSIDDWQWNTRAEY